ncbi:Initiation-specific alpha-1,6-mannosyltransferase [Wickerhamomyces ciferrii]|uniref:Initiation-specific alpha-1,6-mannosyltransferase n=1 Tax=Wickerhamomyces ciferrii (strain ATCC 14091 / BCRC 22168 / CBS 111 / JCM 3599 / NBRC 0793 / NRRL Y-1031 F-60-10) TaxID=1206466 RepID=K0KJ89_WICCF|nr:Initiation-specific alpha-1,6-mannosyltransferase [Wickerhamomyces ciferrii]CCH41178.1 Initiation-specific alpha-1,6-mannosyltransferase [Wickerhamomyces ciferrii]
MNEVKKITKLVNKNRTIKLTLYALFIITITYQFYSSIFQISNENNRFFNKLIYNNSPKKLNDKPDSLFAISKNPIPNNLPNDATLRQQLHYQFPYDPNQPFPKIIWQTWKVPLTSADFKSSFRRYTIQWKEQNPDYLYNVIPDSAAHELINNLYQTIPKIIHAYNILPKTILKADFFRYLILFARGGVYSDIDTVGLKPIDSWVSQNNTIFDKVNNAGVVIGIEADPDRPDWNDYYARRIQFCQWTIQAKQGHPMLGELIAKITEITLAKEKDGSLNKIKGKDAGDDIMNWTGPGIFTDEVFKYLNEVISLDQSVSIINKTPENEYNKGLNIFQDGVDWKFFTLTKKPIVLDDVLVLPITGFSPGVGHMGSKSITHESAYVRHMFEGSWKPENEKHIGEGKKEKKDK